jgi:hypothetical protein
MQITRKPFFDGYRAEFGPLNQQLVYALEALIDSIENHPPEWVDASRLTLVRRLAYMLATFKWETAHTMKPIDEYGGAKYLEERYGYTTRVGKMLGNTKPGDGDRFHGRGFVQLTGRSNYLKAGNKLGVDLIAMPWQAKDPAIAWQIALHGMTEGWFTGKSLEDYIKDDGFTDYINARRIINGTDKAKSIAYIATDFETILDGSVA